MPRICLACASPNREAIDKALANGTPLRHIEGQWDISRSALDRHKRHVATAILKAQEQREEHSGNSSLEEMQRVHRKAWQLTTKAEKAGDIRGAIVGVREVRECVESTEALLQKAGHGRKPLPLGLNVVVEHIGAGITERGELGTGQERPNEKEPLMLTVLPEQASNAGTEQPQAKPVALLPEVAPSAPTPIVYGFSARRRRHGMWRNNA